jgi:autotransporter-associated beta strand protein
VAAARAATQSQTVSDDIADGAGNGGSGSWTLAKTGAGTLTLAGTNTYTGGITIAGGTLAVSADANLGDASGGLTFNGGTLRFLSGFATGRNVTLNAGGGTIDPGGSFAQFNGTISGAGGLTQVGSGQLFLTGTNTYFGPTNVFGGAFRLFGSVTNSLVFNVDNALISINNTGAVNQNAAFTLTNGGTLAISNTLQIGSLAGDATGTVFGATLITGTNNTNTTFAGNIGSGDIVNTAFTKVGTGTQILSGINSYLGATTVNGGTLQVDGSIASSILTSVNNGGTLAGIGTVGATQINAGGTLAPGTPGVPGGAMTVSGNLAFQSGAIYLVQINPANASRANVTGTAALAGKVLAAFAPGSYLTRQYTILHSAGLGGTTFGGFGTTNLPAGFAASLSYTGTDVLLNLTGAIGLSGSGNLNGNQQNVADGLNNFFNAGGTLPPNFLTIFGLSGGNLANALTLLSGEAATGGQQASFQMMTSFLGLMLDPFVDGRGGAAGGPAMGFAPEAPALPDDIALAYASVLKAPVKAPAFAQRWTAWGSAYGGYNKTNGDPTVVGSHDLTARAGGFAAGLDYHVTRDTVVGVALAGAATNWGLAQGLGGGSGDAFQAGAYGETRSGPAYLAAALAFANHWMSTDRFAFAGDHLTASFNAQSVGGRLEGGYRFAYPMGGATPYAAVQVQSFRTPSYSETDLNGGGFALAFNGRTATDTRSELGARFDHVASIDPSAVLTLRSRIAWAHDWVSDPTLGAVFQTLPGSSFIVNGAAPAQNSALASTGAELRLANGVTFLGKLDGEFASHAQTYAGTATVRYAW